MCSEDESFFRSWTNDDASHHLVIDEENGTFYAYLLNREKRIITLVWLYNTATSPDSPPWKADGGKNGPYLNPQCYLFDDQLIPESPWEQFVVFFADCPMEQVKRKSQYAA